MSRQHACRLFGSTRSRPIYGLLREGRLFGVLAGGINIQPRPPVAKLYGQYLQRSGFMQVSATAYTPRKGDIIVLRSYPGGSPARHIAMYDGSHWVSDFQQRDTWAGPGYRLNRPSYAIYRH